MFRKIKNEFGSICSKQKTIKMILPRELLKMRNTITKIKNSMNGFTSTLHTTKEIITKWEGKSQESVQNQFPGISHIPTWSKPTEQRTC